MTNSDLALHKKLFSYDIISQAINDYSQISSIDCESDDEYFYLFFNNCVCEKELAVKEFSNYVIDLHNSRE